jgi:hypothetical protein
MHEFGTAILLPLQTGANKMESDPVTRPNQLSLVSGPRSLSSINLDNYAVCTRKLDGEGFGSTRNMAPARRGSMSIPPASPRCN